MKDDYTLLVGTVQASIWRSDDGGDTWTRAKGERPKLPWSELQCFDLAVHPKDPKVVYAGTNDGVYRSDDRGASFERLDSALNDYDVWSLAIDPVNPDNIYAGCRPGAIFRTKDGGANWEHCAAEFAEYCMNVSVPRVLTMAVDPSDPRKIWAGAEVDGVRRSIDGGETWSRVESLAEPDIHFIAVSPGSNGEPSRVITSTAPEIYLSSDVGESWSTVGARENFPMTFCRGLAIKPDDPNTVFLGQREQLHWRQRHGAAVAGPGRDLGESGCAEAELADVGVCGECCRPGLDYREQPLWGVVRERGQRGQLGEDGAGVQRDPVAGLDAELGY